ncbi:MAG: 4-alpha-glucanotransferase [Candidatus Omnitrophica bacterium]|nr:4-alpha-glucanotransferase [Candidatus Omnitrophota bacterium]MCM8791071.1 4-alpha-glucanotransferase [Candidatus Omnitrophota bacterium]
MTKASLLSSPSGDKWRAIGTSRRAGILVPLFSVYSKGSVGIGDLTDLKLLIDFCQKCGFSILQLLPMNEIGSTFCPYDAVSSFAIEPTYISLSPLPFFEDKKIKSEIDKIKRSFPAGSLYVDYAIKDAKRELLWEIFKKYGNSEKAAVRDFVDANKYWLEDFALFKVLKNHHGGKPWYEWDDCYKNRDRDSLKSFSVSYQREIEFQKWLQYVAFKQFDDAKKYAASKGVLMKGDLPILISRDSSDVWSHPEFFKLDFVAGAPPDMYCAKGQRWGMPTYNWDAIAADNYRYPKEKLRYAENFYDILRIDHAVGFFRIWSIPADEPPENEGLHGVFDPADENLWGEHGRRLLSMILANTKMLLCAEDLGIIPKMCPLTLKEFGIPGNDVQRWVKDWDKKHDFLPPSEYRELSVAMLSTHDTTNWAACWENEFGTVDEALFVRKCNERGIDYESVKDRLFDPKRSKHGRLRWLESVASKEALAHVLGRPENEIADFINMYQNTYLEKEKLWKHMRLKGPMREKSDSDIVEAALKITLGSKSIFSIELIIDYLLMAGILKGDPYKYRINKPGTVARTNWSLTIPIGLEDLLTNKICGKILKLVSSSGRLILSKVAEPV